MLCLGGIAFGGGIFGHLRGLAELLQHIPLLGLVGVKLQAEGADADIVQTLLYHFQRRHFLCYEQHGFILCQGIGDQGGDGLGFTGAGRAVQHEALPVAGRLDGKELGSIGAEGQEHLVLRHPASDFHIGNLPSQLAVHQTADDLVFRQILGAVAHIVPHDELGEGEHAQICRFQHIPPGLSHHRFTQNGEDLADIDAMLVLRQRIQSVHIDTEILLHLFQHGNVHLGFVIPQPDHIALGSGLADDVHRHQHHRGVSGFRTLGRFIPAQDTQGQIQGIGTVFFQRGFRGTVQLLGHPAHLRFRVDGAQAAVFEFRFDHIFKTAQIVHHLKIDAVCRDMPVRGPGMDGEIAAVGQCVFQFIQGGRKDGQGGFGQAHIDQLVPKAQIQQFPFPLHLLGQDLCRDAHVHGNGLSDGIGPQGRAGILLLRMVDVPPLLGMDPQRQRRHTAEPGTVHIDDIFHRILPHQGFFRQGSCLIEAGALSGGKSGAFHHSQFIDAAGQTLGHQSRIILYGFREGQILQPYTGEDMSLLDHQQRMQPRRFQTGSVQQGQIQTGAHFLPYHRVAQPHPLAYTLKAGRGHRIDDPLILQCCVNGTSLGQHPVGILGLVGIQRGISRPLAQVGGGLGIDFGNLRMIGGDKSGNQLRVEAITVPLVKAERSQLLILAV